MSGVQYGAWHGGPDPLEPPYDIRQALDDIGDDVLAGMSPRNALNRLLRLGPDGRNGLDALRQAARNRAREMRRSNRLDGTLDQVRELLDAAVTEERRALFPDPDDSARMAEAELDALPRDTSRAVRALADYPWRSPEAREKYQQIQDLLRSEVLDSQFAGLRDAMRSATPEDLARVRDMMRALNDMLDADARGEHTQQQFDEFMQEYGEFFPDNPSNLEELVDSLARRAAAAQRLLDSLTPDQRAELAGLIAQALRDAGLAEEMGRLQQFATRRSSRPGLGWRRADERRPTAGLRGCDGRAGRAGRPRRADRAVVARTTPGPAWRTSTRTWSSGRWDGGRRPARGATAHRARAAANRAICNAPAKACS